MNFFLFKEVIEFYVQNENSADKWKKPLVIDKLKVKNKKTFNIGRFMCRWF